MPDVKNKDDFVAQFRARVKGLIPSTSEGVPIAEPSQNPQQQDLWQKIKPEEMVGGKQVPKSVVSGLQKTIAYLDNMFSLSNVRAGKLNVNDEQAVKRAMVDLGYTFEKHTTLDWWRNALTPNQKIQIAEIYETDPNKQNVFASTIADISQVEQKQPALSLITSPVTALGTPFAKLSTGQEVSKEEWINFAIMAALSAVPGLQGMGTVAKGAAKAIMAGTGAYQTVQTVKNWDYMSNPERAMAIAIDVALLAGGAPSKGFFKKAINQAKPEVKKAFLSENGELKLGEEPIKPEEVTPVTGEVTIPKVEEVTQPVAEPPQPQIKPVVGEAGIKPPEAPPVKPPVAEVIGKTPSGAEKLNMADLQEVGGAIQGARNPDFARKIGNLPVFKQINKALNPSAIAETPVEKWRVGRAILTDEAQQKTQGVMSYLHKLGKSGDVFGVIDEKGVFKTGKFKGLSLQELADNPSKFDLSSKQKLWLDQAFEIEKAKLDFLKRNGIEVNELSFAEGGRYAGRRVVAKTLPSGELMDVGYMGGGARRPGAKLGAEKTRYFKTAEEAKKAGYVYMPYDEALQLNVQAAYNRVADKMVTDWLLTRIRWRTTGAPEELVLAAETAKLKLDKSKQLLAALNRALRGERGVPEQTVSSIATVLPNEANQLKALLADIRAGRETASSVKQFESSVRKLIASNKSEYQRAVNVRVRAREQALQTHIGEARVEAPAFAGKILTGEEARATADILRKELSPQANAVLTNINKVNAITRYFALAGDFSPFGIQLLFEAYLSPRIFTSTMKAFLKGMSGDLYHARLLNKNKGLIDKHPNLILTSQGTEWTEAFRTGGLLQKGIFKYPGKLLEPFQKGFEAALDEAQLLKAEALESLAKTPKDIADLDQFINELHGMTSSAKLGTTVFTRQVESATLLAPRYFRAIGGLLFDVFRGGLRGKLARESMIKLTIGMVLSSIAIDLARGASEEEIIDRINPMSSNFFTWEVAGQKIGPGSKVRSVLRLIADSAEDPENLLRFSMDNPALRFIRGNLSMTVGTAIDLVLGRNFIGEPTRDDFPQLTKSIFAENLVPLWLQTLWENGSDITDVQGTSVRLGAQLFGGRAYPETLWDKVKDMRESLSQKIFGVAYSELNNAQRDELRRQNADYANLEKRAQGEQTERGTKEQQIYASIKEQIITERNNAMELLAQAYLNGDITKKEYDDRRSYVKPYYSGGMNVLWNVKQQLDPQSVKDMEDWLGENEKPEDKALDAYWQKYNELLDESELPTDWDEINIELENYLNSIKPEHKEYILAHKNDSIYDLPPLAQQIEFERLSGIEDGTWWDYYQDALYAPEMNLQTTPTQELPSEDLETKIRKGFQDILK